VTHHLHVFSRSTLAALLVAFPLLACGGARAGGGVGGPGTSGPGMAPPGSPAGMRAPAPPGSAAAVNDMQRLYRGMGLIAGGAAMPFVASVAFLPAPTADSTLTLIALSLPTRALGFTREGDRYAASYAARLEVRQGATVVRRIEATEAVRVPTFRETARTDESIVWQQFVRLAPGRYTLMLAIKDESSIRNATEEVTLEVPTLQAGALATPIAVYEAIPRLSLDSLPRIMARPRATVVYGSDSILPLYVDGTTAQAPSRLAIRAIGDADIVTWDTTVTLDPRGAGRSATIPIPVTRLGIGVNVLQLTAPGRADTARTRVLVSLGDDLPIASFDEMLGYLRYFTTPDRVKTLRDATPAQRGEVWGTFLRQTDPVPATAEHEGLRDYFGRIRTANARYRDDGPVGWQSDRGIAFVALGDPDNIIDTGLIDPNARVRQQIWEYRELRVQLLFVDQTGFSRWRLNAQSRAELENALRRKLSFQDQR